MDKIIPLVSVAVITFNHVNYIKECIESILFQDYENIEIIIADDCSTDGTQDILCKYKELFPFKIKLILSNKNQGITINSNQAHFSCKGKYISWIGGDDIMLPGKIKYQVSYMEEHPECAICYHNLEVFNSNTNENIRLFTTKAYSGDVRLSIKHGTFNGASSNMIRASNAPYAGFNLSLPVASDWLYWIETLIHGGQIHYLDKVLGRYRRHQNNVTRDQPYVTQCELDHLNTCNIILVKYSAFSSEATYRYSKIMFSIRHKLPYIATVWRSFRIYPTFKAILALFIYLVTIGFIKL